PAAFLRLPALKRCKGDIGRRRTARPWQVQKQCTHLRSPKNRMTSASARCASCRCSRSYERSVTLTNLPRSALSIETWCDTPLDEDDRAGGRAACSRSIEIGWGLSG